MFTEWLSVKSLLKLSSVCGTILGSYDILFLINKNYKSVSNFYRIKLEYDSNKSSCMIFKTIIIHYIYEIT